MIVEYDIFHFEVFYTYREGESGDYFQPDDPDEISIQKILLLSYVTEKGKTNYLKDDCDIQYVLSQKVMDGVMDAIEKDIPLYY